MNNKILVACIAAVVTIAISFYWYNSTSKKIEKLTTPLITGLWTVDSVNIVSNNNGFTGLYSKDTAVDKTMNFGADSVLNIMQDSIVYKYYISNDSLIVKEENNAKIFKLNWINDSTIQLKNDSTAILHLSKSK